MTSRPEEDLETLDTGADILGSSRHSDVPVTRRQTVSQDPLAGALDKLLVASCELAPTATLHEVASRLVPLAAEMFEGSAIGVCIPDETGAQLVVRHSSRLSQVGDPDPTRLFPEFLHETVLAIPYDEGSTLHVASDDETLFTAGTGADTVLDRLALVLGSAIRQARSHARRRADEAEVRGLENQVIQSEKLASLGQIAAGIVHELNNPLTSIVAYSDYLRKKAERSDSDPADVERLFRINEAAERILRFSRDLIAYSRPTSEIPAPVEIHEIIDRALVFCEHVLGETGVTVERDYARVCAVQGVAGQLTQVFVNLVTNACQAMHEGDGGALVIRTAMRGDWVEVTVSDDGQGIATENQERIFEPFFTTKTDGSGTGLGLSIVRNIVLRHRGRIRAEALEPKGTCFLVELPVASARDE